MWAILVDAAYADHAARPKADEASSACHASHHLTTWWPLSSWRSCAGRSFAQISGLDFRAHSAVYHPTVDWICSLMTFLGCFGSGVLPIAMAIWLLNKDLPALLYVEVSCGCVMCLQEDERISALVLIVPPPRS